MECLPIGISQSDIQKLGTGATAERRPPLAVCLKNHVAVLLLTQSVFALGHNVTFSVKSYKHAFKFRGVTVHKI